MPHLKTEPFEVECEALMVWCGEPRWEDCLGCAIESSLVSTGAPARWHRGIPEANGEIAQRMSSPYSWVSVNKTFYENVVDASIA